MKYRKPKAVWIRWIVCALLFISAIADFLTFFISKKYRIFDMSPLTVLTDNILIIFVVKFAVIGGLIYLLTLKKAPDMFRFLWILVSLYLIIFQMFGAISNIQVTESAPPLESAPSEEARVAKGISFAFLWAYYPIVFSMAGFYLWNKGWR